MWCKEPEENYWFYWAEEEEEESEEEGEGEREEEGDEESEEEWEEEEEWVEEEEWEQESEEEIEEWIGGEWDLFHSWGIQSLYSNRIGQIFLTFGGLKLDLEVQSRSEVLFSSWGALNWTSN